MADSVESCSEAAETEEVKSPYGVALPPQAIKVLSEEEIGGRDLLIVGDVHGCFDELKELVDTNYIDNENTCVLFVGDLVNKGPKSPEVVEYVKKNGWYSVRGNHDEISAKECIEFKNNGVEPSPKLTWVKNLPKESLDWLLSLPYALHVPSRQLVVAHAGFMPDTPLEEQTPDVCLHMRCVKRGESGWEWTKKYTEEDGYTLWGKAWSGPEHVYFGHDARRFHQKHQYATGLDTACVYGRELTAVYPLTGRVLKVKSHQDCPATSKYSDKNIKNTN